MLKFFAYILCYLIYPFSFLCPRSKDILVFGSYRGAFNDNSKYLFIYAYGHLKNKKIVWVSTNRKTVKHIRQLGLPAEWVISPKGIWYALRAKFWFVNSYVSDIMYCLSGGAVVVNLWHGVPIKCIEFTITQGELAKRYVQKTPQEVFYHPASFRRPDYMSSTTPFMDAIFSRSFRISESQCMHVGCPRNKMLLEPQDKLLSFIDKYESQGTKHLLRKIKQYDKVFVYMPTWRDSQKDIFANGFDLDKFNQTLQAINAIALMKPHVNTQIDVLQSYSNLEFIRETVDMYTILPFTDVLITDYSSVMYDYVLMPDKSIILFHYDYDTYTKEREFLFPIKENVIGKIVYSFDELIGVITTDDYKMDEIKRSQIIERFWGDTMKSDPCKNILAALNIN